MCKSVIASSIESKRIFTNPIDKIVIETNEGNLTFKGSLNDNNIKILAYPHHNICQDNVKIQDQQLRLINKKNQGGCQCDYTIYLPQKILIDIKSNASNIEIDDMVSSLNIENSAGNIKGNSILAKANVDLGAGNVTLNVSKDSSLIIGAGNGSLRFSHIPQEKVNLEITTGVGSIELLLPADAKVHYDTQPKVDTDSFPNIPDDYNFKVKLKTGIGSTNIRKM